MAINNLPERLTEDQLKWGYWFVTHKILLKNILIGFLICFDLVFLGYGAYGYIDHYFLSNSQHEQMLFELTDSGLVERPAFKKTHRAKDLKIFSIKKVNLGDNKYDLAVNIRNLNERWYGIFEYRFKGSGYTGKFKKGFALPNEEITLMDLSAQSQAVLREVGLEIRNLNWTWISAKQVRDLDRFKNERDNFLIKDTKFIPAGRKVDSVALKEVSRASFTAQNLSAYNYWDVGFQVFLYKGTSLIAMNYISIEQFLSGQSRELEVSWFETIKGINKVEVVPVVDVLNPTVYMDVLE